MRGGGPALTAPRSDAFGTPIFQGRLQRDSATQISLARYNGNYVDVLGELVSIGSAGLTLTAAQNVITAAGADVGAGMALATLYHVYVSNSLATFSPSSIRASATAPTRKTTGLHQGIYYLADTGNGANWRFVGWVRTDSTAPNGNFVDTVTDRLVVNYYNRRWVNLRATPGYVDDNLATTYTMAVGNWARANGGTGSRVTFISNGEDKTNIEVFATITNGAGGSGAAGIGYDTTTDSVIQGTTSATAAAQVSGKDERVQSVGYHTADLMILVVTAAATISADDLRRGAVADPFLTYLSGSVAA